MPFDPMGELPAQQVFEATGFMDNGGDNNLDFICVRF
jgi:hypothetical protein